MAVDEMFDIVTDGQGYTLNDTLVVTDIIIDRIGEIPSEILYDLHTAIQWRVLERLQLRHLCHLVNEPLEAADFIAEQYMEEAAEYVDNLIERMNRD